MRRAGSFLLLAVVAAGDPATAPAQEAYDLVLRGGRVLDGSGSPWFAADVGIRGDRIVAVGDLSEAHAARVLEAAGLYVAPGFIDVHSHAADGLSTPELSAAAPLLAQGITTVVVNPDGGGPVDLAEQRRALERDGLGVNVARLVPHNSVRRQILGMDDRAPDAAEMERMKAHVRAGMEDGAFGLSTGLFSAPGSFSATEEVIELARVAAAYGGVYSSHIRDEADYTVGVVAAVDEVIRVAQEAPIRGVVTHIKGLGPRVWGYAGALTIRIERAREEGVEVFADQYPYTASGTSLSAALLPRWAEVGGRDSLLARMGDPSVRRRLAAEVAVNLDRRGGAARIAFRRHEPDPSIEGRTLADVSRERGVDDVEAALQLIAEGGAAIVSHNMLEADVELLMRQAWVMTCTDGDLLPLGEGVPHPRTYGAFPHKLRRYVLEREVLTLADAVRSMTSLPAAVFRVEDRGAVRPGAYADLVVFDLETLSSPATYEDPHRLAEGMVHVLVNGASAAEERAFTGALAGRVLRPGR